MKKQNLHTTDEQPPVAAHILDGASMGAALAFLLVIVVSIPEIIVSAINGMPPYQIGVGVIGGWATIPIVGAALAIPGLLLGAVGGFLWWLWKSKKRGTPD